MKTGRPKKYDPKYCREIVQWMARGFSIISFAGKIGVDERSIYYWVAKYPDFFQSIKIGKAKSILFWERVGMLGMMGKIQGFSASTWVFQMKNRWGWSEKLSVDLLDELNSDTENDNQPKESPIETMQRLVAKYGKQIPPISNLHKGGKKLK